MGGLIRPLYYCKLNYGILLCAIEFVSGCIFMPVLKFFVSKYISIHLALHHYYIRLKPIVIILHKFSAIILLIAIAGTTFSKAIALLDYKLNENYIATTLCENKDKPACCCHGKCFLKKQLQKDEDGNKNSLPFSKDKFDVSLFCENNDNNRLTDLTQEKTFCDNYLLKKYSSLLSPVFHPPGILS
jgi:hypothetical protein